MENIETFDHSRIAVCSIVHYPLWSPDPLDRNTDTIRGNLALRTLKEAKDQGYDVIVERGICPSAFLEAIKRLGIEVVDQEAEGGTAMRRRAVMNVAHLKKDIDVICWLEAEKLSYVQDGGLQSAIETLLRDQADIVVPKRMGEAFDTYPSYQHASEQRGNKMYNDILRRHGLLKPEDPDMEFFFGPILYRNRAEIYQLFRATYEFTSRETSKVHASVEPRNNNNTLLFPVVNALIHNFRVRSQEVHYVHPKEQTENEEGDPASDRKRDVQRYDILAGLIHFLRLKRGDTRSRLRLSGK